MADELAMGHVYDPIIPKMIARPCGSEHEKRETIGDLIQIPTISVAAFRLSSIKAAAGESRSGSRSSLRRCATSWQVARRVLLLRVVLGEVAADLPTVRVRCGPGTLGLHLVGRVDRDLHIRGRRAATWDRCRSGFWRIDAGIAGGDLLADVGQLRRSTAISTSFLYM